MLYSVGVPWTDCRILRGCVIRCGCALTDCRILRGCVIQCGCALTDFRILRGCVIQCGCALDRLQDFEMLCFSLWQVEGRDEEIERLTNMLDGGRPSDVVALEAKNRSNERMISHLNIQVCCIGYIM